MAYRPHTLQTLGVTSLIDFGINHTSWCTLRLWMLSRKESGQLEKLRVGINSLWSVSSFAFCLLPPTPVLEEDTHHLARVSAPP